MLRRLLVRALVLVAIPSVASAAETAAHPSGASGWAPAIALLPIAAVVLCCYVKIAVVLSVLRAALGSSIPPRSVAFVVAVLLSAFVMAPVAEKMWAAAVPSLSDGSAASVAGAADAARGPLSDFLALHAPARERESFLDLARRLRPAAERASVGERDLMVLAPAFVSAELKAAFQVGFLLLLPFLVLELVVASVLATLGLHSLDARSVSLPFKLLLFVLADGWHLIGRGLILSYT